MVLTKSELIASLQNEVRILGHLASKVDAAHYDYRPTANQRSTIELLRYLSMMGPTLIEAATSGGFDPAKWTAAKQEADARDFHQAVAAIAGSADVYAHLIQPIPDDRFRQTIEMFGNKSTLGWFLVNTVLSGYAAYRTQLFLYLKACGLHHLSTMNLWGGMDPAPK
jgi:hypothetical protein